MNKEPIEEIIYFDWVSAANHHLLTEQDSMIEIEPEAMVASIDLLNIRQRQWLPSLKNPMVLYNAVYITVLPLDSPLQALGWHDVMRSAFWARLWQSLQKKASPVNRLPGPSDVDCSETSWSYDISDLAYIQSSLINCVRIS